MTHSPAGRRVRLATLIYLSTTAWGVEAQITTDRDAETGLRSWTWSDRGVSLQLVQLLPDQTRAFYLGRGFDREQAERIANACVFQSIFRNDGELPLAYDLDDWSLIHAGKRQPMRTRERWDAIWDAASVGEAQRIAMRWALLPTVQRFEPGDYNWGMTSYGLPPGESFDLTLSVRIDDEPVTAVIPSIQCATDR